MTAPNPTPTAMDLLAKLERQINEMILQSSVEHVVLRPGLAHLLEHLPALRAAIEAMQQFAEGSTIYDPTHDCEDYCAMCKGRKERMPTPTSKGG